MIPKGPYCYSGHLGDGLCKFYTYKTLNGIRFPFCTYLGQGDISNISVHDTVILSEYFHCSMEDLYEIFPLDLLWDQVKECGMELDED